MIEFTCQRFADDGTPMISDTQIEAYAEELISDYDKKYIGEPWELDSLKFSEYYLGANLDFVDIYCEEGEQIAGAAIFNREKVKLFDRENLGVRFETYEPNTILIDNETIKPGKEAFARFTVFHEAGHLCMHRSVFQMQTRKIEGFSLPVKEDMQLPWNTEGTGQVICCRRRAIEGHREGLVTQEDFREHQANVFAASILMPKEIFREIAIDGVHKMGCRGDYYCMPTLRETDYDPCADAFLAYMAERFRVSKSAARVQLRKHKLLRMSWER